MRLFRTLILSLIFHLVLTWLIAQTPVTPLQPKPKPTVVDLMDWADPTTSPKDEDLKQIVRNAPPPKDLLTEKKKPARFSSEDDQYVLEERRARANGMTANRSQDGANTHKSAPPQPEDKKTAQNDVKKKKLDIAPESPLKKGIKQELGAAVPSGEGDVKVGGVQPPQRRDPGASEPSKPMTLPNFLGAERGLSTLGEELPDDIKFGDFTALNTDRNLFYSFYARMEERVRPGWERHARAAFFNYVVNDPRQKSKEKFSTRYEMVLDREGHFLRGIIHQGSGVPSLDAAPLQAFRDAEMIPNPPPEMVKEDGTIRIFYQFTVYNSPQYAHD